MLLSIVVSFKNEESNIPELIRRVRSALVGLCKHEIIFVNDASTDGSLAALRSHLPDGDIRIINTSRSFGHGPCLFAGLKHAKGDALVYLDADLQDPPEVIPQMIAEFKNGFEVVLTQRKAREGETWFKIFLTKKAYQFLQKVAKNIFVENAGDFRLISRRVLNHLLAMDERDAIFRGLVSWVGFKTVIIQYVRAPRFRGTSHHTFATGVPARYFLNALVSFSNYPVYFFIALGPLLALLAIASGLYAIVYQADQGTSSIIAIMLLVLTVLVSFLFSAIGILGLYISRIYQQVRARPDYIIESTEGF